MAVSTSTKLNTGASIPLIGLGTWQSAKDEVRQGVLAALKTGYRHIDCAWVYENEEEVGQGIRESGVPREELFVTSKLWNTYHRKVEENLDLTLKALGVDYLDLYLMHWPLPFKRNANNDIFPKKSDGTLDRDTEWDYVKTWKEMERIVKHTNKVRAIGVSNHSIPFLERLLKEAEIIPAANQIELHPSLPQLDLVQFCQSKGIVVEAYSPLGSSGSPLLKDKDVEKIAKKHNVTTANVLINYHVNRGIAVLAKSINPSRIESNFKVVKLDDEDIKTLGNVGTTRFKRYVKFDAGISLGFPDW